MLGRAGLRVAQQDPECNAQLFYAISGTFRLSINLLNRSVTPRVRRAVGGSASLSTLARRAGNKSWVILSFHSSNAKLSRTSAAPSARPPASGCRPSRPPPTPVVPQIADLFGPGDAADRSPLPSRQLRPQRQGGVTARHDLSKGRKVGGQDFSLF